MSLINQMLQDLEQRSAGNIIGGGMQQVRAVPGRSGIHPAWWLVLLLTVLLACACTWFWLRTAAPVPMPPALALRLAADLSVLPSPAAQAPLPLDQRAPVASTGDITPGTQNVDRNDAPLTKASKQPRLDNLPTPDAKPMLAAAPTPSGSPTKSGEPVGAGATAGGDSTMSDKLTKQIRELTSQQRAENDYRRAGSALQQGRQAEAIDDLEQALQLDAQQAGARQMLVGILLQAKRTDEAIHRAQEGLALDPAQIGLAMILARVQVEQGNLRPALDTLEHSLPYAVDHADYQAFLAALLQRDKSHKEAIEHYLAALGKAPQNGVWWMGLGISLQTENRLTEAKEAFGRAKTSNTLTPDLQAFVDQKLMQLQH